MNKKKEEEEKKEGILMTFNNAVDMLFFSA